VFGRGGIELKTPDQLALMREAGLVVARTLALLQERAVPGATTASLDELAEAAIRGAGAVPSFLGYGDPPFPATICASVNDEVVHGIPGDRVLREGDLLSVDCGAVVEGWHADAACTVVVGGPEAVSAGAGELLRGTEEALWRGLAAARVGARVGGISCAVQQFVEGEGDFGLVRDYTGHGVGSALHQPPDVPNVGRNPHRGPRLVDGMVVAVEPMVTAGSHLTVLGDDEWTVSTADGSLAAHFEHTVAITSGGPWVLTALDGGVSRLRAMGATYGGPPVAEP